MKIHSFYVIILLFTISISASAQLQQTDSLNSLLNIAKADTSKVNILLALSKSSVKSDSKKALMYANQAKTLAEDLDFKKGIAYALKSIGMSYYFQGNYIETVLYWQQSLNTFRVMGDKLGIANILNNLGAVNFNEGNSEKAIEYYLESLKVSEEIGDKLRVATALVNIGAVYFQRVATHNRALEYYLKALPLSEELGDQDAIGTTAVNIGEIYLARHDDNAALKYFEKAHIAYKKSKNGNVPYALINIGKVYSHRKNYPLAIKYMQQAHDLALKLNAKLELSQSLLGLADTYNRQGNFQSAITTYLKARDIAKEIGASYELKAAYEGLANLYPKVSDYKNAYVFQTLFSSIKDTLYNAEMDKKLQSMTLSFDLDKKKGEVELLTKDKALQELDLKRQKAIRNAMSVTGILILIMALGILNRYRYVKRTNKIIEEEKQRSEKLLLNILPFETAEELKEKGSATPRHYEMVSVLFTDFKGFTNIAEKLSPEQLIAELNQCFLEFDNIIDRHNLEKIKTIGDSYMCAGGIPVANTSNPIDVVKAGIEIQAYMNRMKQERNSRGLEFWELRVGIHTGKVIAGVIGKNKFAYDIWGDAVNVASRMESSGEPGMVNISGATYEYVKDHFNFVYRGKVKAKNKGDIDMYFVENAPQKNIEKEISVTTNV